MKPARCVCLGALLAWLGWMVFFLGCWQPTSPSPKSLTPSPSPLTLPPVLSPSQLVWSGGQLCPIVPSEINPYGGLAWEPAGRGARLLPQTAGTDGMFLLLLERRGRPPRP